MAAPAGALLWLLANVHLGERNVLAALASLLEPLGELMGMDGVIPVSYTHLRSTPG